MADKDITTGLTKTTSLTTGDYMYAVDGGNSRGILFENVVQSIATLGMASTAISSGTFADARIAQSNVTQHQAALSITESQISDLGAYLTSVAVNDISDVTITGVTSGEILKYNGVGWINNTLAEAGIAAASHTHTASQVTDFDTEVSNNTDVAANTAARHDAVTLTGTGTYISLAGQQITVDPITESDISDLGSYLTSVAINDISDVTITTPADNEVLAYNGAGSWINQTAAEAGLAAASHTHTAADVTDFDTEVTNNTTVAANTAARHSAVTFAGTGTYISLSGQQITVDPITESDISDLGAYITDVVSDTTPQLGGSLDVNGNKIVSAANGNIDIEPNGTGNVLLGNFTFDADQTVGAGQDNYVLTYDNGTGLISLEAAAGGGSGDVTKVGTPVDNQVGVWTGDGTIEGTTGFTWDGSDLILREAVNDGNPTIALGASAAEQLHIRSIYDSAAQTLDYVEFHTDVASVTADKGLFRFSPDGVNVLDIDDGGINIKANFGISINGTNILTDSGGTATLSNIDALDATTEATIEAAIDTLANLTSATSLSITESQISDLGAYITGITGEPLSDLSDVTITAIGTGEILKWNGVGWVNNTLAEAGIAAASHTHTVSDITDLDADFATMSVPANTTISAFGATLVDDANAAAAIATLGLDADLATFSVPASTTISTFGATLVDDASASAARTTLGLTIGTDVQAYDALLNSFAGLASQAAGDIFYLTAADTVARLPKGTADQVLTMNAGATAPEWADAAGGSTAWTSAGTANTTSGTSSTISGIGSSAREIVVYGTAISHNSGSNQYYLLRLGDSGGVETTGYEPYGTTSFEWPFGKAVAATNASTFSAYLISDDGLTWYMNGTTAQNASGGGAGYSFIGSKTLSAQLSQVQISVNGGSFDAGSWEVWYR